MSDLMAAVASAVDAASAEVTGDVTELQFVNVPIACDQPHVRVDTREFARFLRTARLLSTSSGSILSDALLLQVDEDHLIIRATDLKSYLMVALPLLGEGPTFLEPIPLVPSVPSVSERVSR